MVSERFDGLGIAQRLNLDRLGMVRWLNLDGRGLDALVTAQLSKDLMGLGLPDGDKTKGLLGSGQLGKVWGGTSGPLKMTRWG
jgi:hypothetical protein